ERMAVQPLDDLITEFTKNLDQPRLFLKLDTQGSDVAVLRGARQTLEHTLALQSELSVVPLYKNAPDYAEALSFYKQLGFAPSGIFTVVGHQQTGRVL